MPMDREFEKCLRGDPYNCHADVFLALKKTARELLLRYNGLSYDEKVQKRDVLQKLFGGIGENVSVGMPFICDYGCNIYLGNNVSINMNCTFVDCNKITIGNNVLVAPNVQIYTATHPIEMGERLRKNWKPETGEYFCHTHAHPVTIGDGCWIGGGSIILPGVNIGRGSVIGAGSVVTKDIPQDCVAVGNPCRVLRKINGEQNHD